MRTRILLFVLSLILVPTVTYLIILMAKGYRPDVTSGRITPTGLLAATSVPNGAQILVNGHLQSATDTTINLVPGNYQIEIKKEGYSPWKKDLTVDAEVVTRANATLFPSVPSLKAITAIGATHPTISPDGGRVVYLRTEGNLSNLYTLDLSESPLGSINRDAKLITSLPKLDYTLSWSPDGKQILGQATASAYLVTTNDNRATEVTARLAVVQSQWKLLADTIEAPRLSTLPVALRDILATSATDLVWSPRENKILYTATASAVIPENLIRQLPGSNSQPQTRALETNKVYVYDIEEDKNFLVGETNVSLPSPTPKKKTTTNLKMETDNPRRNGGLGWFPDSSHLVKVEPNKVTILEYDGANATVVYAGPMESGLAAPYPSGKQLLILTNLNPTTSISNLYAVSLR
jgi:hypothetical protein